MIDLCTYKLKHLRLKIFMVVGIVAALMKPVQCQTTSQSIHALLEKVGYPSSNYIKYHGFTLQYSEAFEQAQWTMHVVPPGMNELSNKHKTSFHEDPNIKTGSAVFGDYRFTEYDDEGKKHQVGHGYQRGHMVPRADLKWSNKAIDESYFYSNVSPQVGALNQRKWNELENHIRNWATLKDHELVVLTAPVLSEDLDTVKDSKNNLRIPEYYVKAVYDPEDNCAIGFMMANENQPKNLIFYTTSIDEIEEKLGFEIFPSLAEEIEKHHQIMNWFTAKQLPINYRFVDRNNLKRSNILKASETKFLSESQYDVIVCDSITGTFTSKKGNLWLNLGKPYPNQDLSIFVSSKNLENFTLDLEALQNRRECFLGKIKNLGGSRTLQIFSQDQIVKDL